MLMFDIESLDTESTTVILSAGLLYFDPEASPDLDTILSKSVFVKFNAKEQIEKYGRTISKNTLDWWSQQHAYARKVSFDPSKGDVSAEDGLRALTQFMDSIPNSREQTIWARGSLDQMAIDSLAIKVGMQPITGYARWRDVRTAIDIMYGSTNGYVQIDHPTYNPSRIIKHHPVWDCALDAMMLLHGKTITN